MNSKKLLDKHLNLHLTGGVYTSQKQKIQIRRDAAIDAIEEAISIRHQQLDDAITKVVEENKCGHDIYIGTMNGSGDFSLDEYEPHELAEKIMKHID